MKSKAPIIAIIAIAVGAIFYLWPNDDLPGDKVPDKARKSIKAPKKSLVKLDKSKPYAKSKDYEKWSEKKVTKGKQPKKDDREELGKKLRDAVKDGSMSKGDAIAAWRKVTGSGHPWESVMKTWKGKKKGSANGGKNKWQEWARERGIYFEARTIIVRGRLTDEAEQVIEKASLSLIPIVSLKPERTGTPIASESADDGRFELTAIGHRFQLQIRTPDGIENRDMQLPYTEESELDLGDIKLQRAYTVQGLVQGPGGQPLAGAQVRVYNQENYQRFIAAENVAYVQDSSTRSFELVSTETGRFEFQLAAGSYVIVAVKEGLRTTAPLNLINLSGDLSDQNLFFPAPRSLTVVVKDQSNLPLAEVTVRLTRFGQLYSEGGELQAESTTDSEGKATFEGLSKRRYQIVADSEGYARVLQPLQFEDSQNSQDVALTIYTGTRVTGKLISKESGEAVRASLVCSGAQADGQPDMQRLLSKTPVNEDGAFSYERVAPGNYILAIHPRGHARKDLPFTVTSDQTILDLGDVELVKQGEVSMTVLTGSAQPAVNCRVQVWHQESSQLDGELQTNAEGLVRFESLPIGPSKVTVLDKSGVVLGFQDIDFSTDNNPIIRLPNALSTLKGQLLSAANTGQAGTLHLIRTGGHVAPIIVLASATGVIEQANIPPGSYDVYLPSDSSVAQPGFSSSQSGTKLATINLVAEESLEQDFKIPTSGTTETNTAPVAGD
jgi:hypothetical protein